MGIENTQGERRPNQNCGRFLGLFFRHRLPVCMLARMRCHGDPGVLSRRRAVASLLVFASELEKAGRISKASKGMLKGT